MRLKNQNDLHTSGRYVDQYKSVNNNLLCDVLDIVKDDLSDGAYNMLKSMIKFNLYDADHTVKKLDMYYCDYHRYMSEIQSAFKGFADMFDYK